MPSQTRGSIEEGLSQFEHETEKNVNFDAALIGKAGFNGPPVVKLISASKYPPTLLSNQKDLLFNTSTGAFVPTYPTSPVTLSDAGEGQIQTVTTDNITIKNGFAGTLNHSANIVNKAMRLSSNGQTVTIPFDNTHIKDDSLIQIFFQARFVDFDDQADDDIAVYFLNRETVLAANDQNPTEDAKGVGAKFSLFMNLEGDWRAVTNKENVINNAWFIESQEIDDIISTVHSASKFHWYRLDITKAGSSTDGGTEDLKQFSGISFRHSAHNNEHFDIADLSVFVWDGGVAQWDATHNYLGSRVSEISNSNIGVTFTNVTTDSMKIQTTAPFTGWIRYLCSVQG